MQNHLTTRRIFSGAAITLVVLAAMLAYMMLQSRTPAATATPVSAASVTASETAMIPALRGSVASFVPDSVRHFAQNRLVADYGPNPDQARAVNVPGQGSGPWHVMPGNNSVCLTSGDNGGGTCTSAQDAADGKLYIQLIQPPDSKHALPAPGDPVDSTIVGVAPTGSGGVAATTKQGQTVQGTVLPGGLYEVSGTDLTAIQLNGAAAPRMALPGR